MYIIQLYLSGVNIKYFININNKCGICECEKCVTKNGCGDKDWESYYCIFKSGKVIITGGQNKDQIVDIWI